MIATHRVDAALGTWTHTEYTPACDDALAVVLEGIWLFTGRTTHARETIFPDGTVELVFQLEGAYRPITDGPGEQFPVLSIGGLLTRAATIEGPGTPVRVLGIRLRPTGAFRLLNCSLHALCDRSVDLHDVIGRAAAELGDRCTMATSDLTCIEAAVTWIRSRLARAPELAHGLERALAEIQAGGGDVTIAALDALGDASRARLTAAFRDCVGVTPKRFARIVRFRRALVLLTGSPLPLTEIAALVGYYDQAHMNAEFRSHAGLTPRALARAEHYPNSQSLAVQNFQDSADAFG